MPKFARISSAFSTFLFLSLSSSDRFSFILFYFIFSFSKIILMENYILVFPFKQNIYICFFLHCCKQNLMTKKINNYIYFLDNKKIEILSKISFVYNSKVQTRCRKKLVQSGERALCKNGLQFYISGIKIKRKKIILEKVASVRVEKKIQVSRN